jgi:hypothetical protein
LILESDDTRSEPVIEMGKTAGIAKNRETTWWRDFMKPIKCAAGHSGAPPKVASPESIARGRWLWIPGSPLRGTPE